MKDKAPKKPIDGKGSPKHMVNVPGYSKGSGTPGWLSRPAKSAERKAK